MPRYTRNALAGDNNDNYFGVVKNTIVANGINFRPQGIFVLYNPNSASDEGEGEQHSS